VNETLTMLAEMREVGETNRGFRSSRLLLAAADELEQLMAASNALLQRFEYCDRGTQMRVPLAAVDAFRQSLDSLQRKAM
jgi:hypothetical protein